MQRQLLSGLEQGGQQGPDCLLLAGLQGSGRQGLVKLLCYELDWHVLQRHAERINCSEGAERCSCIIHPAAMTLALTGAHRGCNHRQPQSG